MDDEIRQARDQVRIVERAEAAPYVDYPPVRWWYSPAIATWAAGLVGVCALIDRHFVLFLVGLVALVALEVVFVRWLRRDHGALPAPGWGGVPPEIKDAYLRYVIGFATTLVVVVALAALVSIPAGAIAAFVLVGGGVAAYERHYARAADAVKARLA